MRVGWLSLKDAAKERIARNVNTTGIVYGDIGTSVLYAMNETFFGHGLEPNSLNVLGAVSLFVWTLFVVVTIKYIGLIMMADNHGEGGIFAQLGLLKLVEGKFKERVYLFVTGLILVGAALMYGDSVITADISTLSAVEGLKVWWPGVGNAVIPITMAILVFLFVLQRRGTERIGRYFGPIMTVWFSVIALLATPQIIRHPQVLNAFHPSYALSFFTAHGIYGSLVILGAVFLCATGSEACYADMGHCGRSSIRRTWLFFVGPTLVLNYLGQGAKLLSGEEIPHHNIFFSLAPGWLQLPLVLLATAAAVIASQALISSAFSLTQQAIALGAFPRLRVIHTNAAMEGQIYVPFINWMLLAGCIALFGIFRTSGEFAGAYGIAVAGTMAVSTVAFMAVARYHFNWHLLLIALICVPLLAVDLIYTAANGLKFWSGGYVPVLIGVLLWSVMSTWRWGRRTIANLYEQFNGVTIGSFLELKLKPTTVIQPTSVVIMTSKAVTSESAKAPHLLQELFESSGGTALPKHIVICHIDQQRVPRVAADARYRVIHFQRPCDDPDSANDRGTLTAVSIAYGYMADPNVREDLLALKNGGHIKIPGDATKWSIITGRERIVRVSATLAERLRLSLLRLLIANARPATSYFGLDEDPRLRSVDITLPFRSPRLRALAERLHRHNMRTQRMADGS